MIKKLVIVLVLAIGFFGCKENEEPLVQTSLSYYLVGIQASWSSNMNYIPVSDSLYYYQFNDDGSFLKKVGNQSATGTFRASDPVEFDGIVLTFDEVNGNLIHSCYQDKEYLQNLGNNELKGTWGECDGPYHFFKAISNTSNPN